ncbi:MAG: METTL5 family protein [Sulfolobus sp.]
MRSDKIINNKKQLELILEKIPPHPKPRYELEQYLTPGDLVATILWTAYLRGDIKGKTVADLGCGTGKFCSGITALGGYCLCVEIDINSLNVAKEFVDENAEFINADIRFLNLRKVDTVVQNPPFGVVNKGIDLIFLEKALQIANVVYSIHKSNEQSRKIILGKAKEYGFSVEVISTKYKLKPYYPWHIKKAHEFLVDVFLFKKS